MNFQYVSGADNGQFHPMSAGSLTNSGSVRVASRDGGSSANPTFVTIEVRKDQFGPDPLVCTRNVTPPSTVGQSTFFSKACGTISAATYYLIVFKGVDDGWNLTGSGSLST